ncbi:MAG: sporulation membrane protein YtaF [Syntrophomonadaceae bacterium]
MDYLTIVLFALAVSADGFAVGVAYGIKQIVIPLKSLIVIAIASATAVTMSMLIGKGLIFAVPDYWASRIGAAILILMGIYFLLRGCRESINNIAADEEKPLVTLNIRMLGIIIQILKEPARADFDASGVINTREAFFLGLALSLDALGAGIGIALAGFDIFCTAVTVGMLKFILVSSGVFMGRIISGEIFRNVSLFVPGLIFIMLGVWEVF